MTSLRSLLSVLPGSLHWTQPRSSEVSEAEAEDIDTGGGFRGEREGAEGGGEEMP